MENDPDTSTRSKLTPGISIIDLALTSQELGPLQLWAVDSEHQTGSDHELIVLEWEKPCKETAEPFKEITGWHIQDLQEDEEAYKNATQSWRMQSVKRSILTDLCHPEDVAEEALWLQSILTETLN